MRMQMKIDRYNWPRIHAAWCYFVFLYYMVWPVQPLFWGKFHNTYFITAAIIAVSFNLYFRHSHKNRETLLLGLFWVWFCLAKILNGDGTLTENYYRVISLAVCFSFVSVGLAASKQLRKVFLDWFSIVVTLFYAAVGILCLYSMLSGKTVWNPISGDIIAQSVAEEQVVRLDLFTSHPNRTGGIFLIPFCLMIYQFFRCKNKIWRIPILFAFLEFYLCIGLTYSRSCMAAASVCVALLAITLALKRISDQRVLLRIVVVIVLTLLVTPLFYVSFSWSTGLFGKSAAAYHSQEVVTAQSEAGDSKIETQNEAGSQATKPTDINNTFEDNRNLGKQMKTLNGRTRLIKAIFAAYKEHPVYMLLGTNDDTILRYADQLRYGNKYYEGLRYYNHMHNFLLQVLMMTGIPGFLLVLAFSILLLIRMIRVFFSESSVQEKLLICPLAVLFVHFMLEAGLFTDVDVRSLFFFLMAGFVLGTENRKKSMETE